MTGQPKRSVASRSAEPTELLSVVSDAISRLRFGVVQITVHDGKATQVDITERRRFA